ncbi:MAG: acyl-CoA dehydratase activase-related protein [Bacillota bacterium]|jgi:predicted nucleotide-binding protein (sugar kinase/HSP70/actin superfamily)
MVSVGIPKALLYHYYHSFWITFFQQMGFDVKVSSDTNKSIIDNGIISAVDEACLPVKIFYGHVLELSNQVDFLFIPRYVSIEKKEYMCPKLLGIPDMLKACLKKTPTLIDVTINFRGKNQQPDQVIREISNIINVPARMVKEAWKTAEKVQKNYELYLAQGNLPSKYNKQASGYPIALLGHGYNIYDSYINMNIIDKLQKMGAKVQTKEMVPRDVMEKYAATVPKKMFWTFGKQLIGSGLYYLSCNDVRGIIFVASFGCGPDSLVGELLERWSRRSNKKPFMFITIDEHTGEAGIITRLEAFMDMIKRRVS